ncbi:MAG: hypothetical protein MN733_33315, partial [Nitrososphaera sp.]|nr:hypothetical protein [Nitrososphaera sp.]
MRVLVACEFSGIVRDAFRVRGHDAVSCDLLPTEREGPHIQGDVLEHLNDGWDLMIAHPPCTYLTNAGVRHLHAHVTSRNGIRTAVFGEARWTALREAGTFFNRLFNAPILRIAVENPIPHKYAREIIGCYTQLIQPWQFGHGERKATCLWLRNLQPLIPTRVVEGRYSRCRRDSPSPDRWKNRSRTYQGIADAMAEQ